MINPTPEDAEQFNAALAAARESEEPRVGSARVVWSPQPGSQTAFLSCPFVEVLYQGTRGPGKTDALLMSFAQHVGKGYGAAWRGIVFRQTYPQLADVVAKSQKWFRQIFPKAKFTQAAPMRWVFPDGETLTFAHMSRPEDYWNYHGHEYPFIGWEELTNWPSDECFRKMMSCCRSSTPVPGMPRMIRATTNPYGVGHNWVMRRYNLAGQWWKTVIVDDAYDFEGHKEPTRAAIHGHLDENKILLASDPDYKAKIRASASNSAMIDAWLNGSWDLVAGGMFDDVWSPRFNVVPRFVVPPSWRIDRAFDWGSSAPFSVGWYATSDGTDLLLSDGRVMPTVRGDIFRIKEWYGSTGRANEGLKMLATEVARGIVEREIKWGWRRGENSRVRMGVADSAIFVVENGVSISVDMSRNVRLDGETYPGVTWHPADKRPGSRKHGWEKLRMLVKNAHPTPGAVREQPGLFVVGDECPEFLRTFPTLPRDPKDMDDVDTKAEDHIGDEVRYRCTWAGAYIGVGHVIGGF